MRRGAPSPSASLPWLRRRCVSSSSLASSLMRASGPDTLMPAWSSCTSSRSTGTLRTSANWETVTSAIRLTCLEPRGARGHDELRRLVGGQPLDVREALLREDRGDVLVHVELLHEVLHEFLRLRLALGLGVGFGHDVEIPAAELAREADVLAAAPDRLRQLVLRHRDVHAVRV